MNFDVVTIGSITIDYYIPFNKLLKFNHKDFFSLELGDKILIEDYYEELGGGSSNTALAFKKLNLNTSLISKIGDDFEGKKILDYLKKYDLNFSGKILKGKSAFSIVLENKNDRTIIAFKGVVEDPLKNIVLPKSNFYYFTSPSKKGLKTYVEYFKKIKNKINKNKNSKKDNKKNNKKTKYSFDIVFNPSSYITNLGLNNSFLKQLLFYSDIVILNKDELLKLYGKNSTAKNSKSDNGKVKNENKNSNVSFKLVEKIVDIVHSLNTDIVVVTDGSNDIFVSCKSTNEKYLVKPWKIKVKETTGAGDAFGSTFAAILYKKQNLLEAVKYALINSENVIKSIGPKKGLLSLRELNKKSKMLKLNYKKL